MIDKVFDISYNLFIMKIIINNKRGITMKKIFLGTMLLVLGLSLSACTIDRPFGDDVVFEEPVLEVTDSKLDLLYDEYLKDVDAFCSTYVVAGTDSYDDCAFYKEQFFPTDFNDYEFDSETEENGSYINVYKNIDANKVLTISVKYVGEKINEFEFELHYLNELSNDDISQEIEVQVKEYFDDINQDISGYRVLIESELYNSKDINNDLGYAISEGLKYQFNSVILGSNQEFLLLVDLIKEEGSFTTIIENARIKGLYSVDNGSVTITFSDSKEPLGTELMIHKLYHLIFESEFEYGTITGNLDDVQAMKDLNDYNYGTTIEFMEENIYKATFDGTKEFTYIMFEIMEGNDNQYSFRIVDTEVTTKQEISHEHLIMDFVTDFNNRDIERQELVKYFTMDVPHELLNLEMQDEEFYDMLYFSLEEYDNINVVMFWSNTVVFTYEIEFVEYEDGTILFDLSLLVTEDRVVFRSLYKVLEEEYNLIPKEKLGEFCSDMFLESSQYYCEQFFNEYDGDLFYFTSLNMNGENISFYFRYTKEGVSGYQNTHLLEIEIIEVDGSLKMGILNNDERKNDSEFFIDAYIKYLTNESEEYNTIDFWYLPGTEQEHSSLESYKSLTENTVNMVLFTPIGNSYDFEGVVGVMVEEIDDSLMVVSSKIFFITVYKHVDTNQYVVSSIEEVEVNPNVSNEEVNEFFENYANDWNDLDNNFDDLYEKYNNNINLSGYAYLMIRKTDTVFPNYEVLSNEGNIFTLTSDIDDETVDVICIKWRDNFIVLPVEIPEL